MLRIECMKASRGMRAKSGRRVGRQAQMTPKVGSTEDQITRE